MGVTMAIEPTQSWLQHPPWNGYPLKPTTTGTPLPKQPANLGVDWKWRVEEATAGG